MDWAGWGGKGWAGQGGAVESGLGRMGRQRVGWTCHVGTSNVATLLCTPSTHDLLSCCGENSLNLFSNITNINPE